MTFFFTFLSLKGIRMPLRLRIDCMHLQLFTAAAFPPDPAFETMFASCPALTPLN